MAVLILDTMNLIVKFNLDTEQLKEFPWMDEVGINAEIVGVGFVLYTASMPQ